MTDESRFYDKTAVDSSLIEAFSWHSGILVIYFHGNSVYAYSNVPIEVADALNSAESKGRYFINNIRDRYPLTRI